MMFDYDLQNHIRKILRMQPSDGVLLGKVREECIELADAVDNAGQCPISDWGRDARFSVVSEMADVAIVLRQLALRLECVAEFDAMVEYKVARTEHEMEQAENGNT